MWSRFVKNLGCLFLFFILIFLTVSCEKTEEGKKEIDFHVCRETEMPDELKEMIEHRKEKPFQLIYEDSAYRYCAAGYGRQERNEYVVAVRDFYETEDMIVLDTVLTGRKGEESWKAGSSEVCPYILIRFDLTGKSVLFK
jgi:hypothetical protein